MSPGPATQQIGMDVHPVRGLVQPKQSCTLAVVLRATKELRLDGVTLSANIRGGKPAKVPERSRDAIEGK